MKINKYLKDLLSADTVIKSSISKVIKLLEGARNIVLRYDFTKNIKHYSDEFDDNLDEAASLIVNINHTLQLPELKEYELDQTDFEQHKIDSLIEILTYYRMRITGYENGKDNQYPETTMDKDSNILDYINEIITIYNSMDSPDAQNTRLYPPSLFMLIPSFLLLISTFNINVTIFSLFEIPRIQKLFIPVECSERLSKILITDYNRGISDEDIIPKFQ